MALLGQAAVAMWWDMAVEQRDEFEHWHSHEHFPERMSIPGFLRGSRWHSADGGEGFFVMYELAQYETLTSPAYLERLNAPTPWSTRMMPHHRNMVRSQCRVLNSIGGGLAGFAVTIRLSPRADQVEMLRAYLATTSLEIAGEPGTAAAHLLQTQTPTIAQTLEQKIRGGADQVADWIFVACAYRQSAIEQLLAQRLGADSLIRHGASCEPRAQIFVMSHSLLAAETC